MFAGTNQMWLEKKTKRHKEENVENQTRFWAESLFLNHLVMNLKQREFYVDALKHLK